MRRNQFYLVAKSFHLVRPVVRAAASFKNDQAALLLSHEHRKLRSRELSAELDLACPEGAMNLENILCQIHYNRFILYL